jgi:hypothetical protein
VIRVTSSLDPRAATSKQSAAETHQARAAAEVVFWSELAQQLRVDSIRASAVPKSGHPTSSMSASELMAVLISKYLRYDFDQPDNPGNDHLVFSKGHASPLLYSIYKACGAISDSELLTFRSIGSRVGFRNCVGARGSVAHQLGSVGRVSGVSPWAGLPKPMLRARPELSALDVDAADLVFAHARETQKACRS